MTDVAETGTPALVREFASLRVAAWTATFSRERHERLSAVVDELRQRGVLD